LSIPMKAVGAFSMPTTVLTAYLMDPLLTH